MDSAPNTPVKMVTARIPASLDMQLRQLAADQDRSVSAEIRRALARHLEQQTDLAEGDRG
jgi:hypothetical protein